MCPKSIGTFGPKKIQITNKWFIVNDAWLSMKAVCKCYKLTKDCVTTFSSLGEMSHRKVGFKLPLNCQSRDGRLVAIRFLFSKKEFCYSALEFQGFNLGSHLGTLF